MKDAFLKSPLAKTALIIPALGLFILGGVVTQSAFADTASGSGDTTSDHPPHGWFQDLQLTDAQKAALEQAKTLRESGDSEGAKAVLEAAGVPMPPFGPHDHDDENRPELTDEQKAVLEQAKALRDSGDEAGAKALLEQAGIQPPQHGPRGMMFQNLTDEQKAALDQARSLHEAGDDEGAKAVLEAAGIQFPPRHEQDTSGN